MDKFYKTTKPFDYLSADQIYRTYPLDKGHTRFWNIKKECGTFIANWQVEQAISSSILVEVSI